MRRLLEERLEDVVHLLLPQRPQVHVADLHALPAVEPRLEVALRLALQRVGQRARVEVLGVDARRVDHHFDLVGLAEEVLDEAAHRLRRRHVRHRAVAVDAEPGEALAPLAEVEHRHLLARRLGRAQLLGVLRVHEGHLDLQSGLG